MKFSDMLISLIGCTRRERAIEELAWKSNIYAQEAEKLVDALDKMMPTGAWVTVPEYDPPRSSHIPMTDPVRKAIREMDIPLAPVVEVVDPHNLLGTIPVRVPELLVPTPVPVPSLPWEQWGDAAHLLQAVVDKLPILDGLTVTDTRTSLFDVLDTLRNKEGVDIYAAITDAINDDRVTRWHVKTVTTLITAWLGDEFFTRTKPHKFDAGESMRSIVQQSERHIGSTRSTLIRVLVMKALDDGHHVLPVLLECAQVAAKKLKEQADVSE